MTSLAVKQAAFLRRTVVPQVPPPVDLERGSQEPGKIIVPETKRQLKRNRAKRNKHARREATAERHHPHYVGDPADDTDSDDDGSPENFHRRGSSGGGHCTDACCAGIDEYGQELVVDDAEDNDDEDACIEDEAAEASL